jgi:hypothetical protein
MKTIKKYLYLTALVSVASLVSCTEKPDDWIPGPNANPTSTKAYFEPSGGTIEPGGESLELSVSRLNTEGAATVPIHVVKAPKELVFPAKEVTFKAGEKTVVFEVRFTEESKYEVDYPFELKIDDASTSPYLIEPVGFIGKLRRLEPWVFVAEMDCTYEARGGSKRAKFDPWKQKLYKKNIAGTYRIEDWCLNGTGEWYADLIFSVDGNKQMLPDPSIGYHDIKAKRWYFYEPGKASSGDDTQWQINGHLPTTTGVYMTYFYLYTVGNTTSSYDMTFDPVAKTATLGGYSRFSKSTFSSGAFHLHYTW